MFKKHTFKIFVFVFVNPQISISDELFIDVYDRVLFKAYLGSRFNR